MKRKPKSFLAALVLGLVPGLSGLVYAVDPSPVPSNGSSQKPEQKVEQKSV